MISDWKKMFVPLFAAIFAVVLLQTVSAAAVTVTNRTGTIRITRPDGAVLTVNAEDPLPEIPSGSKIELLTGAAEFALTEGSIEVIVAGSRATVEAGDGLVASIDEVTGAGRLMVTSGSIQVAAAGIIVAVESGEAVEVSVDPSTGAVQLVCITGTIEVVTIEGERIRLAAGESFVTPVGEILIAPPVEVVKVVEVVEVAEILITEEEPAESEVPEASPYRP